MLHAVEAFGGGQLELVRQLAVGGARAGHETAVAHGIRPQTAAELAGWREQGVEMFPLSSWGSRSPLRQLRAPAQLRRLVRTWRPDLVHLHSSFAGLAGALSLPRSIPTAFSPQAFASTLETRSPVARRGLRTVERLIVRRAGATVACSPSEARYAAAVLGGSRVELVENGIPELDRPPPPRPPADPPTVVASGRLVSQRQPESCARILGRVADVARVRWVGGGGGDRFESGIAALRRDGVEVTGWLPREQAMEEIATATAYLHWTAADGQPLSILEAMALDVPVVASDIPPSRDLLPPDQIRRGEEEAAELLRTIVTQPGVRATMLAEQRRRRGRYAAERMISETLALYDRLLGSSQGSR